jgi:hypothetical protein
VLGVAKYGMWFGIGVAALAANPGKRADAEWGEEMTAFARKWRVMECFSAASPVIITFARRCSSGLNEASEWQKPMSVAGLLGRIGLRDEGARCVDGSTMDAEGV